MNRLFSRWAAVTALWIGLAAGFVQAQDVVAPVAPSMPVASAQGKIMARLNFSDAPLDIVLADYSEKTGKTLLRAPGLPTPVFTLRSQGELSLEEYLKAIETVLTMHGVGLVESGDKFIRVVPVKAVRREALEILETIPEGLVAERSGAMVSQMVSLKHIDIAEATKAIDPLRNENGQLNPFERTNALMITDFPENINRILQVLRLIDQPVEAREEPNIIQIRYAKASDIKARLLEIIAESQKEQQASTVPRMRTSGAPGVVQTTPPGIIRPSTVRPETPVAPQEDLVDAAERGIIRGKVQIVADERTNKLIIITRPENMTFFERIILVLDVETSPDVMVKVLRLDFAAADKVAGMLNDLIGATKKDDGSSATARTGTEGAAESKRLAEIEAALAASRNRQPDRKSSVGELSKDNIKILSDERTNSLILMASKSDLATLEEIIKDMDMMLSQVLIEAVIIDVTLKDGLETGVSWIQKSMTAYTTDSSGQRSPAFSFAGGGGGGAGVPMDAAGLNDPATLSTSGLGYFFTMYDLNLSMILKASATDDRTRVVSTPALLTTDNTEATLTSTDLIYVFEGTTYSGTTTDNRTAKYRQDEVGLILKVKPQINANHVVMMKIEQEISEPGSDVAGSDTENLTGKTISSSRKIDASIAVKSGQTIVLGGQVRDKNARGRSKIPLLGDIPLLGRLFNSDRRSTERTETIVFITPYVLDTPDAVDRETQRRRDSLNIQGMWKKGWSGSDLAEPPSKENSDHGFPRKPAKDATSDKVPESRPVARIEPWTSSDGKVARVGGETPVVRAEPAEPPADPASPVPPAPPAGMDQSFEDIDQFIIDQQRKWDEAVQGRR